MGRSNAVEPSSGESGVKPASFGAVFAVGEFRALFAAHLLSVLGDQFARMALAVLVYRRTASAGLAALAYALTLLPDLVGGPLLSGLADRLPRRLLMIGCDLARALLVALMALPGAPLWILCLLLVAVQLLNSPFSAARAALLAVILQDDLYVAGSAVSNISFQFAQLAGFATGGLLIAGVGPPQALLIDAATFLGSALLVRLGVARRTVRPDSDAQQQKPGWWRSLVAGARLVWIDRRLRALVALACVSGFYITVEGLAVPYAASLGGGAAAAGLLLAANPAGSVIGMIMLTRWVPPRSRLRWIGPLAVAACLPLLGSAAQPGLMVTATLWALSGAFSAFQIPANAAFMQAVPDANRGQAFGLAVTALRTAQGAGILIGGVAADQWSPAAAVAGAGVLGVLFATLAGLAWTGATRASARAAEA
ncbi:MAG: MFS transporter [Actinomycetota bacterium]|nr:MFS transporter [Actinomycetota bacterium]